MGVRVEAFGSQALLHQWSLSAQFRVKGFVVLV